MERFLLLFYYCIFVIFLLLFLLPFLVLSFSIYLVFPPSLLIHSTFFSIMDAADHYYNHCPLADESGDQLVYWIAQYTGSCVYGSMSAFSWTFGYISLTCWLGAQLPQIVANYRNGSVEGLSFGLVFNWFMGDFTNFVGCVLTHQLPFQTLLAFYYICVDIILGGQYYYYTRPKQQRFHLHSHRHAQLHKAALARQRRCQQEWVAEEDISPISSRMEMISSHPSSPVLSPSTKPVNVPGHAHATTVEPNSNIEGEISNTPGSISFFKPPSSANLKTLFTSSFVASFSKVRAAPIYESAGSSTTTAETVHKIARTGLIASLVLKSEAIGVLFAWICTCCYLTSRLPQIYSNWKRKSTSGTAILLFLAALTGNVTYTLSILLSKSARGPEGWAFLRNELPFLLGSAGTVMFDVTILIQWIIYKEESDSEDLEKYQPLDSQTIEGVLMSDEDDEGSSVDLDNKLEEESHEVDKFADQHQQQQQNNKSSRSGSGGSSSTWFLETQNNARSTTTAAASFASEYTPLSSSPQRSYTTLK